MQLPAPAPPTHRRRCRRGSAVGRRDGQPPRPLVSAGTSASVVSKKARLPSAERLREATRRTSWPAGPPGKVIRARCVGPSPGASPARLAAHAADSRLPFSVAVELGHAFVVVGGQLFLGAEEQRLPVGAKEGGLREVAGRRRTAPRRRAASSARPSVRRRRRSAAPRS